MRLIDWRTQQGLTQTDLAKRLGVTKGAVCGWEGGDYPPRPAHARKIIEVTAGAVGYEDLYGAPETAAADQAA